MNENIDTSIFIDDSANSTTIPTTPTTISKPLDIDQFQGFEENLLALSSSIEEFSDSLQALSNRISALEDYTASVPTVSLFSSKFEKNFDKFSGVKNIFKKK